MEVDGRTGEVDHSCQDRFELGLLGAELCLMRGFGCIVEGAKHTKVLWEYV